MALDPQDIERKDFPIGRRGYEPEAVDAHLRRLATEVSELQAAPSTPRAGGESLAVAASEQVRTIVEAAESSAAAIQRQAEEEARSITDAAAGEADSTRSEAAQQAQDHVHNVSAATSTMLQRVDAMETELGALLESLRTGANRLQADLTLLEGNMTELHEASGHEGDRGREARAARRAAEPEPEPAEAEAFVEDAVVFWSVETAETPAADAEGARLIALNMALNGSPREETDRYLADNFNIENRESLLDEVYSRVG